jgi:Ser/Thr protein kinase RdoA (MazF antagonist)
MQPSPPARADEAPYAGLTPDVVLEALDAVGLRGDGRLLQLNSYENRVFQVFLEDGKVVVAKFYRADRWSDAQILEEHTFAAELEADEVPVVGPLTLHAAHDDGARLTLAGAPPTLATLQHALHDLRFAAMPRRSGQAPELDHDDTLERIGGFIARLHAVGRRTPFLHRRTLGVEAVGRTAIDWLRDHDAVPEEVVASWQDTVEAALAGAERLFAACGDYRPLRLHGDCHPGNVLWTRDGPHFVDLDDAVNGPAVQDLWMLLSGDRAAMTRQLGSVLSGYERFLDFDRRELHLVEALRTLRMLHHSAWLAQRWNDPAFPVAFPWFGDGSYWRQQIVQLREQIEAMAEPPLEVHR